MTPPGQAGGGSDQLVTKSEGRDGVLTDSDDTTKKNCALYFAFIPFKSGTYKNKTLDNVQVRVNMGYFPLTLRAPLLATMFLLD